MGTQPLRVLRGGAAGNVRVPEGGRAASRQQRRVSAAVRLRAAVGAARRRDWMALAEQLTWIGLAALMGFGAGVVVGLMVTAASMGPGWLGHPVLAVAGAIRRLPVPGALSALVVLGAGFALVRLPVFGRTLLLLAKVAVAVLAVAVAYRLVVG